MNSLVIYFVGSLWGKQRGGVENAELHRYAAIISARNESAVIGRLIRTSAPSAPTCLPRLLGEYAGELDVRFDEHARLLFPEYVEELEDLSPAHIFQRRIHGAGYSYRQCFDSGVLNFRPANPSELCAA